MPEIANFPYPPHLFEGGQPEEAPAISASQGSGEKPPSNVIAIGRDAEGSIAHLMTDNIQIIAHIRPNTAESLPKAA